MGASILGFDTGLTMPKISTAGFGGTITIIAVIIIFTILIGIVIWFIYQNKIFNKKIIIFENIAGQGYQPTGKDKARLVKIGDSGEEILFLQKRKVNRTAYGRKMGTNTYWFAVGQDGYWYNTLLGDLDAKMGMLDIEPVDRDMRYMHVAIRKNIQERYRKIGVMEKYGPIIISGLFLLIMVASTWFLISKIGDLVNEAGKLITAGQPIAESIKVAVSKLDTICSASGIRAA